MMKNRLNIFTALIIGTIAIGISAFAEDHMGHKEKGQMMMQGEKKEMMNKDMSMMDGGGMMGGMMRRKVVATSDGGVIIVVGNLLLKYDRDLELVKKTTIKISDENMQQMMNKMKKHRDMCRKMCQEKMADE